MVGEAARLVIVGLERIEEAFDRLANAVAIARYPFARLVLVGLQPGRLERLLAKDRKRAVIRVVGVVKKHSNGAAERGDFRLEI